MKMDFISPDIFDGISFNALVALVYVVLMLRLTMVVYMEKRRSMG